MSNTFIFQIALLFHFFLRILTYSTNNKSQFYVKGSPNVTFPLKSIKNSITISEGIAKVLIIQEYSNDYNVSLETEYFFPINTDAVFDGFQAKLNNKTFIGKIKEKEAAKQEYQKNLEQGNTVAYSEIDANSHDIMKVNLGNILPNQTIFIQYSYIQPLELVLNRFKRFILYSTLTPRYDPGTGNSSNVQINEVAASNNTYKWDIWVNLSSVNSIPTLYSPSHKIVVQDYQTTRSYIKIITLDSSESRDPNKDFVLIFEENQQYIPKVIVEKHQLFNNSTIAMLSFYPELNSLTTQEAQMIISAKNETNPLVSDIQKSKGEFFFIIDRSGSMYGDRIENLKKALVLFLKSLPNDSYFNVISFGSQYEPLFKSSDNGNNYRIISVRYNDKNLAEALEKIQSFDADLGGTEIYDPIDQTFNSQIRLGYPKIIFLLTDGDVSNSNQIVRMIKNKSGFSRVYTVGIGNGVSTSLIKRMAAVGKGSYEFVQDSSNLEQKTINLLHKSISPYAYNIEISFSDDSYIQEIFQRLDNRTIIIKNEVFRLFMFLKDSDNIKNFSVKVSYQNSYTGSNESMTLSFDEMKLIENSDLFHKFAIKKKIDIFTEELLEAANEEMKSELISDSIKYQVLSEYTAFILVLEGNQNTNGLESEKVNIGNIQSQDYSTSNSMMYSNSTSMGGYGSTFINRLDFLGFFCFCFIYILFMN